MKKVFFCLLLVTMIAGAANAQLSNSKWKGIIKTGQDINVSFDFAKDTLVVKNLDENTTLETMIYSVNNSQFTIQKLSGQSDCDNTTLGKYSFQIKDNKLIITLVEDTCDDRAPVLNHLELTRNT